MYTYWSDEKIYLTERDEQRNPVKFHIYENYEELLRALSVMNVRAKSDQLVRTWYYRDTCRYLTIRDSYCRRFNPALVEKDLMEWKRLNNHHSSSGTVVRNRHLAKGCRFRTDPVRLSYDDPSPRNCQTGHRPLTSTMRRVRHYANIEKEYHDPEYGKYLRKKARTEDPWSSEPWTHVSRSWKDQSKCCHQWEKKQLSKANKGEEVMRFDREKATEREINNGTWDYDSADDTERQVFDIVMEQADLPKRMLRKKTYDLSSQIWDDLGIDSLGRYELLGLLEEKYQMEIEGDEAEAILTASTIKDVADGMAMALENVKQ